MTQTDAGMTVDEIIDNINPGEFTFCSRCGENDTVRRGPTEFVCVRCSRSFPLDRRLSEDEECLMHAEIASGRATFEARERMIRQRMANKASDR